MCGLSLHDYEARIGGNKHVPMQPRQPPLPSQPADTLLPPLPQGRRTGKDSKGDST